MDIPITAPSDPTTMNHEELLLAYWLTGISFAFAGDRTNLDKITARAGVLKKELMRRISVQPGPGVTISREVLQRLCDATHAARFTQDIAAKRQGWIDALAIAEEVLFAAAEKQR